MDNMDKMISDFDQANEMILRTLPSCLKSYYDKLIKEGFSEEQSFMLVQDYQGVMFESSQSE